MTFKVTVPNRFFEGKRLGVEFKAGEALIKDSKLAESMKGKGYLVEPVEAKQEAEKAPTKKAPAKRKSPKKVEA